MTYIDDDGVEKICTYKTLAELKEKVESMLNDVYAKKDFIIVSLTNYDVLTTL